MIKMLDGIHIFNLLFPKLKTEQMDFKVANSQG